MRKGAADFGPAFVGLAVAFVLFDGEDIEVGEGWRRRAVMALLVKLVFCLEADGERQIVRADRRDQDKVRTKSPKPGNRGRGKHWPRSIIRPHAISAVVIAGDDPAHRA